MTCGTSLRPKRGNTLCLDWHATLCFRSGQIWAFKYPMQPGLQPSDRPVMVVRMHSAAAIVKKKVRAALQRVQKVFIAAQSSKAAKMNLHQQGTVQEELRVRSDVEPQRWNPALREPGGLLSTTGPGTCTGLLNLKRRRHSMGRALCVLAGQVVGFPESRTRDPNVP